MAPVKVLICPLDWGIGHATRCVPIILKLRSLGHDVMVAASGRPLEFLRKEFPDIPFTDFKGVDIHYPRDHRMTLKILRLAPIFLWGIYKEHQKLKKIIRQHAVSFIISDNRYGCWNRHIPSVFITHQLEIQLPSGLSFLSGIVQRLNYLFIHRYDHCWIPDFEPHKGLAGALSHPPKLPRNAAYIGTLSRFTGVREPFSGFTQTEFDVLVMLSGPEPQRSILEDNILRQLVSINLQVAMVRGMPESDEAYVLDHRIHVFAHLGTHQLQHLINHSSIVICRSGYSSIMDMVTLGKQAIFIPTPGQTEQEYLAHYLRDKKIFFSTSQEQFDILYALEMSKNYPGMVIRNNYQELERQIKRLIG